MRILLLHTRYRQPGGEDAVFRLEGELLRRRHEVRALEFSNESIGRGLGKIASAAGALFSLSAWRRTRAAIREFQPDVLHVHNLFLAASPSVILAARSLGVPVVLTLHNFRLICPSATLLHRGTIYTDSIGRTFPLRAIRDRVYRGSAAETALLVAVTGLHKLLGTWRRVARLICLTGFARDLFASSSLRVPADRLVVKPNFVPRPGEQPVPRGASYLFVGRLSEEKGVDVLLRAFAATGLPLRIAGDGPLADHVQAAASTHPGIVALGRLDAPAVAREMAAARALIFPSIWYEGMPMTLLEAFAQGLPVVASRLGAMESMVQDGRNGLLFAPGDERSLAAALSRLEADPALRVRLSEGALACYESDYTPERNLELLEEIYRDAVVVERSGRG